MIRILIADDSILIRTVLRDALNSCIDMTVAGEAANGEEAVSLNDLLKPDLIIMDILMPLMDGLKATEVIMAKNPTPILILSSTLDDKDVKLAFTAIKKGALDVMGKPSLTGSASQGAFFAKLQEKIRLLSKIKVIHHIQRGDRFKSTLPSRPSFRGILAIGASTGGPKAVMSIIKTLPQGFSGAVFIVQHISSGFAKGFAHWLDLESNITVRLAETGDLPTPGTALVAPTDCQMVLEGGVVKIIDAPAVNSCRPSIDVFFESLASCKAKDTVGLLLTGMGRDGAQGLLQLKENGAFTIAQDEQSCAVFGMPKAAIALNAANEVLPLEIMPEAVMKIFNS
ncbi:MAG: chemotaxis-specific protein-glutamate methyltransferase CheB [Geobacteraceae bacterium]|nr:chemotaxis-specific protein-glutamate methyltransferase CheB [Geobacteraceae bacterium]